MARAQSTVEQRRSAGMSPRPSSRRAPHADIAEALSQRVVVEQIEPEIDGGRFPIKRTIGETVDVSATIFADGHDVLVAMLRDRHEHSGFGIRDSGFGAEGTEGTEDAKNAESAESAESAEINWGFSGYSASLR